MRRNPLMRQYHGGDAAVLPEYQPVQADDTMIGVGLFERAAVVANHPFVRGAGQKQHGMMARAFGDSGIVLQYLAAVLEGAVGVV